MKEIKIKFIGFWNTFNEKDNFLVNPLKDDYKIVLSDEPDYIFVSCFNNYSDFVKYPNAIRIFVCGEDMFPDFTFFDYWIGYGDINYNDRFLYYPCFLYHETWKRFDIPKLDFDEAKKLLKNKNKFCNFIYGEDDKKHIRSHVFNLLNAYKKVDSAGKYLNNQPNSKSVSYLHLDEKLNFQKQTKFSIVVECEQIENYVSEKIHHALLSHTIPIYYGPNYVNKIFNSKCFINANDYKTDEELLKVIKAIDSDDDSYLTYLTSPAFIEVDYVINKQEELFNFLDHIFDQDKKDCFRRANLSKRVIEYENSILQSKKVKTNFFVKIIKRLFIH